MDFTSRMVALLGELRRERNGAVADAMRFYGAPYGLNYGVSLPTLRRLARAETPDHDFARYLYRQEVRELRLAALHIACPERLAPDEFSFWAAGIVNSEVAEEAAFALLSRADVLPALFDAWIADPDPLLQYAALQAAARSSRLMAVWIAPAVETVRRAAEFAAGTTGESVARSAEEPVKPVAKTVIDSVTEPVTRAVAEPVTRPVTEPAAKPLTGCAAESAAELAAGTTGESVVKTVAEPVKPAAKPVADSVAEPVTKPVTEPAAKLATGCAAELDDQPAAESVVKPVTGCAAEAAEPASQHAAAPLSAPLAARLVAQGAVALLTAVGVRNEENRQAVIRAAGSLGKLPAEDYVHEELAWRLEA